MKKGDNWYHKLERFVDHIIPYSVLVLLLMIIAEVGFTPYVEPYHKYVLALDYLIVCLFVLDLVFKYNRVRTFKDFLRKYWLDIIAVFPFFLLFRVYERLALLLRVSSTEFREGQTIFHEFVEVEKGAGKWVKEASSLSKEAEAAGKISRTRFIIRVVRPAARVPRLLKILPFFERPAKRK